MPNPMPNAGPAGGQKDGPRGREDQRGHVDPGRDESGRVDPRTGHGPARKDAREGEVLRNVRMLHSQAGPLIFRQPGQVYEMPADEAQRLIDSGAAEDATELVPPVGGEGEGGEEIPVEDTTMAGSLRRGAKVVPGQPVTPPKPKPGTDEEPEEKPAEGETAPKGEPEECPPEGETAPEGEPAAGEDFDGPEREPVDPPMDPPEPGHGRHPAHRPAPKPQPKGRNRR